MTLLGDWIALAPWKSRHVLLIDPAGRHQENTITGKRALAADHSTPLIVVWSGQYATTARFVHDDERDALDAALR